ncbi:hypothetical protein EZV62_024632 [Acer yangbiense]|uniref:Uncharacterized protein n=1 Tax=Acer yangbiense TaxID=1000413 RepID=A0A5C7GW78_9ROSI|nr:hypothetical protein EZV62_024632 [Acer yangbiense]
MEARWTSSTGIHSRNSGILFSSSKPPDITLEGSVGTVPDRLDRLNYQSGLALDPKYARCGLVSKSWTSLSPLTFLSEDQHFMPSEQQPAFIL